MASYALRRRSFLASLGGAFGLQILLDNLEAGAEGVEAPPRLLVAHFPRGTLRQQFLSVDPTNPLTSRILSPFATSDVSVHTSVLFGLTHRGMTSNGGDRHPLGLIFSMTGSNSPGVQSTGFVDPCAGGPSWDQRFLRNVGALAKRDANGTIIGRGYYNVAGRNPPAASRASGCLSYSYTQSAVSTGSGMISANQALLPIASPITAYNDLFSGFVPGNEPNAAIKALIMRKSVLDSALRELARVRELAPASEWVKIDAHADTIRRLEAQLQEQITGMGDASRCTIPPLPPRVLDGPARNDSLKDYDNPVRAAPPDFAMVVRTHASIVRAAFACDLIRVATLSCLPAEHDEALTITDPSFFTGSPPESGSANYEAYEAIANAHVAVNETMAAIVNEFRTQVDPLDANPSANLLDRTIIPFVTEVAHCGHEPDPMPALLFGGYNLGIRGGRFENFEASPRPHNDLWVTLAQALFRTTDPLAVLADEDFAKDGVTPIAGLYTPPP